MEMPFENNLNTGRDSEIPSLFLSYCWQDKHIADGLDQFLRDSQVRVIRDERSFIAGRRLHEEIERAISESDLVVAIYSASSSNRAWPKLERELAQDKRVISGESNCRLIYFRVDETPLPISEKCRLAINAYQHKGSGAFKLASDELIRHIHGYEGNPIYYDWTLLNNATNPWVGTYDLLMPNDILKKLTQHIPPRLSIDTNYLSNNNSDQHVSTQLNPGTPLLAKCGDIWHLIRNAGESVVLKEFTSLSEDVSINYISSSYLDSNRLVPPFVMATGEGCGISATVKNLGIHRGNSSARWLKDWQVQFSYVTASAKEVTQILNFTINQRMEGPN